MKKLMGALAGVMHKVAGTARTLAVAGTVALASAGTALVPSTASAQDYAALSGAVDWADVGTALFSVGVAIVGIVVIFKGIKMVVRAVRSA